MGLVPSNQAFGSGNTSDEENQQSVAASNLGLEVCCGVENGNEISSLIEYGGLPAVVILGRFVGITFGALLL